MSDKERLELLWAEYRYRHEHVWRVIFQITAAATVLAVAPYLNIAITKGIDLWALALPVLAPVLIAYGFFALNAELRLLSLIRDRYREVQHETLGIEHDRERRSWFSWRVRLYLGFLFVLGVLHVGVTAAWWIPHVRSLPPRSIGQESAGDLGRPARFSVTSKYPADPYTSERVLDYGSGQA